MSLRPESWSLGAAGDFGKHKLLQHVILFNMYSPPSSLLQPSRPHAEACRHLRRRHLPGELLLRAAESQNTGSPYTERQVSSPRLRRVCCKRWALLAYHDFLPQVTRCCCRRGARRRIASWRGAGNRFSFLTNILQLGGQDRFLVFIWTVIEGRCYCTGPSYQKHARRCSCKSFTQVFRNSE